MTSKIQVWMWFFGLLALCLAQRQASAVLSHHRLHRQQARSDIDGSSTVAPITVQTRRPTQPLVPIVPSVVKPIVPTTNKAKCFWAGTPPFCSPKCGRYYRVTDVDRRGDGKMSCWTGVKKLCCPTPELLALSG